MHDEECAGVPTPSSLLDRRTAALTELVEMRLPVDHTVTGDHDARGRSSASRCSTE
jgi:hypothetical protein